MKNIWKDGIDIYREDGDVNITPFELRKIRDMIHISEAQDCLEYFLENEEDCNEKAISNIIKDETLCLSFWEDLQERLYDLGNGWEIERELIFRYMEVEEERKEND